MRYWTASVLPAIVGTALPLWLRPRGFVFKWSAAVEFLAAVVLLHAGFSLLHAVLDRGEPKGRRRGLLLQAAVGCVAGTLAIGAHLNRLAPGGIFVVYGLTVMFSGLLYISPPFSFHSRAGGEIVLAYGLGMMPLLGAYLLQTGDLIRLVYVASLPIVAATGLWVWTARMATRDDDRLAGRETLVTSLGDRVSGRIAAPAIVVVMFASLVVAVASSSVAPSGLAALASLVPAWKSVAIVRSATADTSRRGAASSWAFLAHLILCAAFTVSSLQRGVHGA